ncbi:MAG: hypothetical protein IPM29_27995 [Planctomycetes bacterium]|nr:hypothetical protein [Planctomycetota bacterium]
MTGRAGVAVCAAWIATLGGCGSLSTAPRQLPLPCHRAPDEQLATMRRVCLLTFRNAVGVHAEADAVRATFAEELQKLHRFEVVPLPADAPEDSAIHAALMRAELATGPLAELVGRYGVDGVVIGTITAERPYQPPHLGVRLRLVSLHDGATLWSVDALFDSADARVQEDCRHYAETFQAEERSMHGWEMNLLSPQRYRAYVAHRVVATLR